MRRSRAKQSKAEQGRAKGIEGAKELDLQLKAMPTRARYGYQG